MHVRDCEGTVVPCSTSVPHNTSRVELPLEFTLHTLGTVKFYVQIVHFALLLDHFHHILSAYCYLMHSREHPTSVHDSGLLQPFSMSFSLSPHDSFLSTMQFPLWMINYGENYIIHCIVLFIYFCIRW